MSVEGKRAPRKFSIDAQIDPSKICGNLELRAGSANFFNGHGSRRFLIRNNGWVFRSGHIFDSFYITSDWLHPTGVFGLADEGSSNPSDFRFSAFYSLPRHIIYDISTQWKA